MNTNKIATGSTSKRLLAALAVLAVAFVVLAAVPAIATDSDSDAATADDPLYGIIYAGYGSSGTNIKNAMASERDVGDYALFLQVVLPAGTTGVDYLISTTASNGTESYYAESTVDGGNSMKTTFFVTSKGTSSQWAANADKIGDGEHVDASQIDTSSMTFTTYKDGIEAGNEYTMTVMIKTATKEYTDTVTVSSEGLTAYKYNASLYTNSAASSYTLVEGATVYVKEGASLNGTLAVGSSSIKFDGTVYFNILGLKAGSSGITITAGEDTLNLSGDVIGDVNQYTADSNKITLSDKVDIDKDLTIGEGVTVEIASGAVVTVKSGVTLTNNGTITGATAETLVFEDGSKYIGQAILDDSGIVDLAYTDGSVITYQGRDYVVYVMDLGNGNYIRFGLSGVTIEYSGENVTDRSINRIGPRAIPITAGLKVSTGDFSITDEYAGKINEPDTYEDAILTLVTYDASAVQFSNSLTMPTTGSMKTYVDIEVTKIQLSNMTVSGDSPEIKADDITYTGKDLRSSVQFTIKDSVSGKTLDLSNCDIAYYSEDPTAATTAVPALADVTNAGTYYAVVSVKTDSDGESVDTYFEGTSKVVSFKVVAAELDILLNPDADSDYTIDVSWNSERYSEKAVTSTITLAESGAALKVADIQNPYTVTIEGSTSLNAAGTALLTAGTGVVHKTGTVSWSATPALSDIQTMIDDFMAQWTDDDGVTFYVQLSVDVLATTQKNIAASSSAIYTVNVKEFLPLEDYVTFKDDTDTVTFKKADPYQIAGENAYTYIANGVLSKEDGAYTFSFTATGPDKSPTLVALNLTAATDDHPSAPYRIALSYVDTENSAASAHGDTTIAAAGTDKAAITNIGAAAVAATDNAGAGIKFTVTISAELAIDAQLEIEVLSTQEKDAKSVTYTIDLSGLAPELFKIVLNESNYKAQTYQNYVAVTDSNGDATDTPLTEENKIDNTYYSPADGYLYFTLDSYFNLPDTAANTVWKLTDKDSGVSYNGGSVYTIASKDIKKGVISFYAASGSSSGDDDERSSNFDASLTYSNGTIGYAIWNTDRELFTETTATIEFHYIYTQDLDGFAYQFNGTNTVQSVELGSYAYEFGAVSLDDTAAAATIIGGYAVITVDGTSVTTAAITF